MSTTGYRSKNAENESICGSGETPADEKSAPVYFRPAGDFVGSNAPPGKDPAEAPAGDWPSPSDKFSGKPRKREKTGRKEAAPPSRRGQTPVKPPIKQNRPMPKAASAKVPTDEIPVEEKETSWLAYAAVIAVCILLTVGIVFLLLELSSGRQK